jgi:hypothetical protein
MTRRFVLGITTVKQRRAWLVKGWVIAQGNLYLPTKDYSFNHPKNGNIVD